MIPLFSLKNNADYIRNLLSQNDTTLKNNDTTLKTTLKLMAGADSIHDFFDTVRVPDNVFINVSNNLITNLNTLYKVTNVKNISTIIGKDGKQKNQSANEPYKTWLENLSEGKITASDIEKKTEVYFENKYPKNLIGKVVKLTYRKVITEINKNINSGQNNNAAIYQAYTQLCLTGGFSDTLEIDMEPGEIWDTAYSTQDKTFIGLFLLNFFFTPQPLNDNQGSSTQQQIDVAFNTKNQTYMTFDANSNIPTKIFGLLDQVINLVTPLNIADSASDYHHLVVDTSQKRASVKNKYVFPFNTIPPNVQITTTPDKQVYLYNSNIYTISDGVNLYIEKPTGINIEYGEKNKYDFKVYASNNRANIDPCEILRFTNQDGTTYTSGPGVKYLSNMIDYNGRTLPEPEPSNSAIAPLNSDCMNLFDLTNKPKALYYDLKRSGDWEQCIAALTVNQLMQTTPGNGAQKGRVILCTLDRLCALFSRSIGQNAIYHTGTKLHLYRYAVNLTSQERESQRKIAEEADRLKALSEQQAAAEAETLLLQKQQAAYDIKTQITSVISNLREPLENYLTKNIFIEKLKVSNSANENIYKMINFFARILFIKSLKKLKDATGIEDPQAYFDSLNEITDSLVTPLNYAPFIDNINKYVTEFSKQIMLRGKLGDYDSEKLIELYSNLKSINKEIKQDSKSITKHNYKKKLEKEGVFSILELILKDLEPGVNSSSLPPAPRKSSSLFPPAPPSNFEELTLFVDKFKGEPYNSNLEQPDFASSNKEYYGNLKKKINDYASSIPSTPNRGGADENQHGGDLSEKERQDQQNNGYRSLMLELTNEFMSLSVSLNEITESIVKNKSPEQWNNISYEGFITKMKSLQLNDSSNDNNGSVVMDEENISGTSGDGSVVMDDENNSGTSNDNNGSLIMDDENNSQGLQQSNTNVIESKIDYTNKILEILEVFFENSWKAIQIAELNEINTTAHKKLYYTIYTFFACLYGYVDINDPNNHVISDIINKPGFLKFDTADTRSSSSGGGKEKEKEKKSVKVANKVPYNSYRQSSSSTQQFKEYVKVPLNRQNVITQLNVNNTVEFINKINFLNDYIDTNDFINTIRQNMTNNTWFINLIIYCIKARVKEKKQNEYVLTVFTTLSNFFKYCIYYKVKDTLPTQDTSNLNMSNLNNYGFNNGLLVLNDFDPVFGSFFNKLKNFTFAERVFFGVVNDINEITSQQQIFFEITPILSILSNNFINPNTVVYQLNELNRIRGGSGKYTQKKYKSKSKKMKTRKNNTRNKKIKRRKTQKRIHKRRPQKTRSNKWD